MGLIMPSGKIAKGLLGLFHGSKHDFDAFDFAHMGKGEGAQARGWGGYLSSEPEFAGKFRGDETALFVGDQKIDAPTSAQKMLAKYGGDVDQLLMARKPRLEALIKKRENASTDDALGIGITEKDLVQMEIDSFNKELMEIESYRDKGVKFKSTGKMYKVDVDAAEDQMLDWDKPLSEQSEYVQSALKAAGVDMPASTKGKLLYYAAAPHATDQKVASQALLNSGIKGVKYKDTLSTKNKDFKYAPDNYVVFDQDLMNIRDKWVRPETALATGLMGIKSQSGAVEPMSDLSLFNYQERMGGFDKQFALPKGQQRGAILPTITDKEGFVGLGLPQFVVDTLRSAYDVGQSRKSGVGKPASLFDVF